jgi:hypothetical protein
MHEKITNINQDYSVDGVFCFYFKEEFHDGKFTLLLGDKTNNRFNKTSWDDSVVNALKMFQLKETGTESDIRYKAALEEYMELETTSKLQLKRAKYVLKLINNRYK